MAYDMKPPSPPGARALGAVLDQCAPLEQLQRRMRESAARFEIIRHRLPGALASQVRPGPIDEQGWSILTTNPAVAAKLRQLVPRLEAALAEAGRPAATIRIKLVAASSG